MLTLNMTEESSTRHEDASPQPQNAIPHYEEFLRMAHFIDMFFLDSATAAKIVGLLGTQSYLTITTTGFGTLSNILNLIVFYRQGILSDSCTVSLSALAVCDFISCLLDFLSGTTANIALAIDRSNPNLISPTGNGISATTLSLSQILNLMITIPYYFVFPFGGWATANLALERMVSVTFPFRVKALFTPKRSCIILACMFFVCFSLQAPRAIVMKFYWFEMAGVNGSVTRILKVKNEEIIPFSLVNRLMNVNKSIFPMIYVAIIVFCNIVVAVKVTTSQKFRKSFSSSTNASGNTTSNSKTVSKPRRKNNNEEHGGKTKAKQEPKATDSKTKKELRLIRMMYFVSFTFLLSRIPETASVIMIQIQMGISAYWWGWGYNKLHPLYMAIDRIGVYLTYLNGATNVVIYYLLSKRYRQVFWELFPCCRIKIVQTTKSKQST